MSLTVARVTGGLATPTILPTLENAGYTRSFEHGPAAPAWQTTTGQVAAWSAVRWRPAKRAVYLPAGARLDVGGVGEGWAVQKAARWLSRINYTLGQILLPFASGSYRPLEVGLGQLALYGLAVVVLSFYVRSRIGPKTRQALQPLSFAVFGLSL